jgi:ATP-dependent Clp protease ATP-binding subunit ClpC
LGVLLFLGPTGVGKTETARLVASFLFGGPEALARFDMSEYMEEHSVARLIGAPPGYVGHEEEGQLPARLHARPYGVVLLDEVEKAHPRVFDVFLQVFDAGRLTDGQGRVADARHAIFIMTSNLGTSPVRERPGFAGGDPADERPETIALEEVRRFFRPELLNRIDEQVIFRPLGPEDAARIVKPMLQDIVDSVRRQHGVVLNVEPAAEAFIAQAGFDPARGVREVRRAVERLLQAPLSNLILEGKIRKHPAWTVAYDEGGVYLIPAPRG